MKRIEQQQSGAETVSQQLDLLNTKYQRLCESLRSKLEEVAEKNKDDPEIQVGFILHLHSKYIMVEITVQSW